MAFTAGDTREIEELVESLRFVALEIPTKCAVQHILLPENISYTFLDIFIGDEFDGSLPDDIETIQVSGPSGRLAISEKDFRWEADLKFFWVGIGDSVADSHDWIKLQNVALHERLGFSMAQSLE
jgi:hypothetical protein